MESSPLPPTPSSPSSTTPFPKHGVTVIFLTKTFVEEYGGINNNVLEGLTTTEVCEKFVKPATASTQTSYCEWLLTKTAEPAVGTATVFISHAWKYKFLDVIAALAHHFREEPETIVWFDLFSNNQHVATDLNFRWWCNTFKSAIQQFGRTVMVLAPWNDPIPLRRAWCLFELYCTVETDSLFEVAMSQEHQQYFLEDMMKEGMKSIDKMLATIDVANSEAWNPQDRERIFEVVQQTVGFDGINAMVFEEMRGWVITVATLAIASLEGEAVDEKKLSLKMVLGKLFEGQGKYAEAEPLYVECLALRKAMLGDRHPATLQSLNALAALREKQGHYAEAEPLYVECLALRKVVQGDREPETLSTMHNLAVLFDKQGRFAVAEPLFVECLALRKEVLGQSHPGTLQSMNGLAVLYNKQARCAEAEPIFVECLELQKKTLGDRHPETISVMGNLASLYKKQGRYAEAEPLLMDTLALSKEVQGERHPNTLASISNLAALYDFQGKFDEAEPLYKQALALREEVLGVQHPSTLVSMNRLASLYLRQERYDEAEALSRQCLALSKQVLGDRHPDTLISIGTLADICDRQARDQEAEALFTQALDGFKATLGVRHPNTKIALSNLAQFFEERGRKEEAEKLRASFGGNGGGGS